jgi:hypothetical protein
MRKIRRAVIAERYAALVEGFSRDRADQHADLR